MGASAVDLLHSPPLRYSANGKGNNFIGISLIGIFMKMETMTLSVLF
jgi:hypothetical protein